MKTTTNRPTTPKSTPRPETATAPSAEATPRFKKLVDAARGKKTAPTAEAPIPPDAPATPAFATLKDLGTTWIEYLKANDAAVSTWASYQHDFETAAEHFGPTTDPATLTPDSVTAYESSPAVMQTKKGRPKSMPTILKTRRVLRLAFAWAKGAGRVASIPYSAKTAS